MRRLLLALAAALAFGCTPDQATQPPPTVAAVADPTVHLVGVAGPHSGRYGVFGKQLLQGATAAVAEINRNGGVLGKPLKIHLADDQCDPKLAVAVARDLATRGAVLVDGHFCSSSSLVASEVYATSQAVMISPASTHYRLTIDAAAKGWRHVFRTAPNDERQGDFAATWLARNYRGERIAVVHDDSSFGQRIAAAAQRRLESAGMPPVLVEQIRQRSGGSNTLVPHLVAADPKVVYFAGYHEDAASLVKRLRAGGSRAVFMGTDAIVDDEFWRQAGPAGQGTIATFLGDPRRHPRAQPVVSQFKAQGIDPEGYVLFSYAAIQVWAEAARRAGSVERDRVAAALHNGSFDTALGTIAFDAAGDLVDPPFTMYIWNNGAYGELSAR